MRTRALRLGISLVVPLALAACAPEPEAPAFDMEAWAQDFFKAEKAAFERGEYDELRALEDADVVYQNIDGTVIQTHEGHLQSIEDLRASFDNVPIHQEWTYLMGDNEVFAASIDWTFDVPDNPIQFTGLFVGRVVNGKLVEEWGAGKLPTAPAGSE